MRFLYVLLAMQGCWLTDAEIQRVLDKDPDPSGLIETDGISEESDDPIVLETSTGGPLDTDGHHDTAVPVETDLILPEDTDETIDTDPPIETDVVETDDPIVLDTEVPPDTIVADTDVPIDTELPAETGPVPDTDPLIVDTYETDSGGETDETVDPGETDVVDTDPSVDTNAVETDDTIIVDTNETNLNDTGDTAIEDTDVVEETDMVDTDPSVDTDVVETDDTIVLDTDVPPDTDVADTDPPVVETDVADSDSIDMDETVDSETALIETAIPILDADGDGSPDDEDCDPSNSEIYPGASDRFDDGIDQDCQGGDAIYSLLTASLVCEGVGDRADACLADANEDGNNETLLLKAEPNNWQGRVGVPSTAYVTELALGCFHGPNPTAQDSVQVNGASYYVVRFDGLAPCTTDMKLVDDLVGTFVWRTNDYCDYAPTDPEVEALCLVTRQHVGYQDTFLSIEWNGTRAVPNAIGR